MEKGGQPIIIVDPRKEETKGKEALSMVFILSLDIFLIVERAITQNK